MTTKMVRSALSKNEIKTVPCVNCAYCCKATPCPLAIELYPALRLVQGLECPGLYYENDRYFCRHYDPLKYPDLFGWGCGQALFNSVRQAQIEKMKTKSS